MPGTTTAAVKIAKRLASGNFGYSQTSRWSGFQHGKLHEPGNLDCSSSTGVVLKMAGYPIDLSGTFYTGNIVGRVLAAGYRRGPSPKDKSQAWLSKHVTAGAVLRGEGHVVIGVGGGKVLSFEIAENGTADGKPGDQTGREGRIRPVYVRSRGWTDLLLPPADPKPTATRWVYPTLRRGSKGPLVLLWKRAVKLRHPILAANAARAAHEDHYRITATYRAVDEKLAKSIERRYKVDGSGRVGIWMWRHLGLLTKVRRTA